jgi:hypothetical protein
MSTMVSRSPSAKKISSWVRPGVCEVRASAVRPVSALISDDLPTLERPAKAISGAPIGGRPSDLAAGLDRLGREVGGEAGGHVGCARRTSRMRLSNSSTFTPARHMMKDC